ncbi:deferrochelatase/peroxidase EfeB [Tistlia consotensis]|uniref:Deferrochelatase n=1 Tax=Tistlia consotensis USBA 355 TaxID=560819 RepID=A0A1Y6B8A6_9PROT|nr:iron uptake transporter deferrochelatase/peroxidase subunit [Tistlia consotensis]SME96706.1 deferrochelatase/peroxidase EfeB [Tistlia consotensis USBA 355]SNR56056.1 deferrochelatase/peroxidase EfeB [Tistlia consotensis]
MPRDDSSTSKPFLATDRRRLLLGLGAAAGGTLAGSLCPAQAARAGTTSEAEHVADAPLGTARLQQRQPFHGPHQAGIVTPRPAAGLVAAFDVVVQSPADLERLFRALTVRIAFLTQGGRTPQLDPKLPPADSGILGPEIEPDNLTITVGLGAALFENRPWLRPFKPKHLQRMAGFPNDALDPELCHGDLSIQFCANTPDSNIHALRDLLKNLSDQLVLRWLQDGSVPVVAPAADGEKQSARNLLGFRDGTANPDSGDPATMARVVWVGEANDEPAWARGGSYQVVRIIRMLVESWDRTPLGEQQRIFGRKKVSGAPLDGRTEADVPDYAADPDGRVTPLDSHIRRANPRTPEAREHLILRRPFNYANGVTKSRQLEQGLLFVCYQADLEKGFLTVQGRLDGEPLEEYVKPIGGGYFYALPGVPRPGDYLGRPLVEALAARPSTPS